METRNDPQFAHHGPCMEAVATAVGSLWRVIRTAHPAPQTAHRGEVRRAVVARGHRRCDGRGGTSVGGRTASDDARPGASTVSLVLPSQLSPPVVPRVAVRRPELVRRLDTAVRSHRLTLLV